MIDRRRPRIGIELDVVPDDERGRSALHPVPVALEVDAPKLVRDELALVGVEWRVRVEVDHGRRAAVRGGERRRLDGDLALLEVPVRPHRAILHDVSRRRPDVDAHRQLEHRPEPLRPRAGSDHHLLADLDSSLARRHRHDRAV